MSGLVVRVPASGAIDSALIPSQVEPASLELVFTAYLLKVQHSRDRVKTSWQGCLCRWEMHLVGFLHVSVVDRWPATPKRACYSALIAFFVIEG